MSLEVGQALRDGIDDLTSERGLLFVAVFVLFGLLNTVVSQSLSLAINRSIASALDVPASAMQQQGGFGGASNALGLELPIAVAAALTVLLWALGTALRVVAIRSFAFEGPSPLPSAATDNLVPTVLTALGASVVMTVLLAIGFLLLVIPGLVLAVLFFFVMQEVALNDSGVVESLKNSIDLVGDNIGGVVALIIVTFALGAVITLPLGAASLGLPGSISSALTTLLGQIASVFGIAVVTSAYQQAMADEQSTADQQADEF
ncbi:hypothetical protein ACFQL1_04540 [Halomicroarcula sp. GCM10025709]|uniref:DUF7847 domain-containing protein n=1 Tax=Haloarcula TaxID=2237 RepID=UPI0024C2416E|nr:hypothetical protein [Halomicroarcula sp. YJ-61-S]